MAAYDADLIQKAAAYVAAYDAWWSSLTRPPFNDGKSAGHRALVQRGRDAWRAFDRALAKRGIVTTDRYALARELAQGEETDGR